jgi:hypothetical protein
MNKDYNISTNPYTLSLVKDILAEIKIENIPLFEDKNQELREYVTTSIILDLSGDIKKLNAMFKSITQDPETDFALFGFNELFGILDGFFVSTGDRLISWKRIQSSELNNPNGMDLAKIMEMMQKNPDLMKIFDTSTEITSEA